MAYVNVEINLEEFDDDQLIEELEDRGYTVDDPTDSGLTSYEIDIIVDVFAGSKPGSPEYVIYEKLRKK